MKNGHNGTKLINEKSIIDDHLFGSNAYIYADKFITQTVKRDKNALLWEQGAAGSNPATSTLLKQREPRLK